MRPSRQVVAFGTPKIFPVDYYHDDLSCQVVVLSGGPATVEYTNDDVNDSTVTPTWFAAPPPINSVATSAVGAISNQPVRALRFTCTVSGSASFIVLQPSGGPMS